VIQCQDHNNVLVAKNVFKKFYLAEKKKSISNEKRVLYRIVSFAVNHYLEFPTLPHQKFVSLIEAKEEFGVSTADKYVINASKIV